MADIDVLEQRAEALETQVAEFQTALDREQAQVDAVLAANAGTAEELAAARVEISRLQTELADAGINVERIQAVNARLDGIAQSIITTREDLESTIPDTQEPDQPEGPENPGGEGEAEDGE